MTTVAYDGKTLAVDSLVTGGFMHTTSKVFRLRDGSYGAGAGVMSSIQRFFREFDGDPATIPEGDFDAVVMHLDGRVVHYSGDGLILDITGSKYALGSGSAFALGALCAGKTSAVAVAIACDLDENSGLPVETIKRPRVKKQG